MGETQLMGMRRSSLISSLLALIFLHFYSNGVFIALDQRKKLGGKKI